MGIDKGGLDYTISVRDQFSSNVDAFRTGIKGARADFRSFKRELAQPIRSSSQRELARASREQAKALRDEASAIRKTRGERRDAVKVLSLSRAAKKALGKETRRLAIAQAKANLEVKRNLVNSRQQLAADQLRVRAERDLAKVIDARGRSEAVLAAAKERGVVLTTEELRKLKLLTLEQEKLFLAKKKLREQEAVAGNSELRRISAEAAALKTQNRLLQEQANLRALAARGLGPTGAPLPPTVENRTFRDRIRNFLALNKAQGDAALSANRFSFTFRRLIGILAAFTVVRLIVRGFTDLVRQLISFNANIEQSVLGIAALFTAVGDVRDATGEAATSSQSLAIAQKEAARQTALLRKEALATAATFDTLLETFQVAVAPGLVAGLDIDEIRRFTVRISQAASAIGLQQNQLAEEIRSILSGTIQARTTRIAVALGITNEDIRLAKQAGVLTQFLGERFEAFKEAGLEALGTFNALLTNVRDSILLLFEEGGLDFFEELKGLLKDVLDLVVKTDIGEALAPNPRAVSVVRAIADGLRDAVAQVRALISEDALGGLEGLATLIGGTISVISAVLAPVIGGILAGLNDIRAGFVFLKQLISDLGLKDVFGVEFLANTVKQFVRISTSVAVTGGLAVILLGTVKSILTVATLIRAVVASTGGKIGLFIAAVGFLVVAYKKLVDNIVGGNLGFTQFLTLITDGVSVSFQRAFFFIKTGFQNLFSNFRILILEITRFLSTRFLKAISEILQPLALISTTAAAGLKEVADAQDQINDGIVRQIQLSKDAIAARNLQFIIDDRRLLTKLDDEANDLLADSIGNAVDLRAALLDIPGIISRARKPLAAQGNLLKELTQDALKAADALSFSEDTFRLGDTAIAQRRIEFERLIALRDKGLILTIQEREVQQQLVNIGRQKVRNERAFGRLSETNQALAADAIENAESLIFARNDLARAETKIALERLRLKNATGDELEAAQRRVLVAEENEKAFSRQVTLLESQQKRLVDTLNTTNLTKESQEAIVKVIKDRVVLNGQETATLERRNDILRDRTKLESRLNRIAETRIQQQSLVTLGRDIENVRRPELEIEARRRQLAVSEDTRLAQNVVAAENRIQLAQFDLRIIEERNLAEIESLQAGLQILKVRAEANGLLSKEQLAVVGIEQLEKDRLVLLEDLNKERDKGEEGSAAVLKTEIDLLAQTDSLLSTLKAIDAAEAEITQKRKEGVVAIEDATQKTEGLEKGLQRIKDLNIPSIGKQLGDALADAVRELATVGVPIIQKFSQFASQAIVDAFDPTKDVNLKERFAKFFQEIARMILELTIRIAILRAFGGVGAASGGPVIQRPPAFAARGGGVGPFGMAPGFEGGGVPNKPAPASMIPTNLPATDKVPIWTTVGEWIMRKSAVSKYGNDVMSAINRGLVDPSSLRSLAGIRGRHSSRSRRHAGFQDGGLVSDNIAAARQAEDQRADDEGVAAQAQTFTPILIADNQTMQRLIDGGSEALLDFMRENQSVLNTQEQTI